MSRLTARQSQQARQIARSERAEDGWLGSPELIQVWPIRSHAALGSIRAVPSGVKVLEGSIPTNEIITRHLKASAVTSNVLDVSSVTTPKIDASAVTSEKVAFNAISNRELAPLAVDTINIRTGAVGSEKIGLNAVTNSELAGSAVDTINIRTGAVGNEKLATGSVTALKIANKTVDATEIKDGAVGDAILSSGVKGGADANFALRKIGLGSGPAAAGDAHSHSTSTSLRFEILPEESRQQILAARATIRVARRTGAAITPPELRAMRTLILSFCVMGIDGMTETAEERQVRRASSGGYNAWLDRKVLEMYFAEVREGTTVQEPGYEPAYGTQSEEAYAIAAQGKKPKFARMMHPDFEEGTT